jgi:hypothetical protein
MKARDQKINLYKSITKNSEIANYKHDYFLHVLDFFNGMR